MSAKRYSPSQAQGAYPAPTTDGPVHAELTIPGSKSLTNRELIIAAIADGPGRLIAPLHSDDSRRMIEALRALGIGVEEVDAGREAGAHLAQQVGGLAAGHPVDLALGVTEPLVRLLAVGVGEAARDAHRVLGELGRRRARLGEVLVELEVLDGPAGIALALGHGTHAPFVVRCASSQPMMRSVTSSRTVSLSSSCRPSG